MAAEVGKPAIFCVAQYARIAPKPAVPQSQHSPVLLPISCLVIEFLDCWPAKLSAQSDDSMPADSTHPSCQAAPSRTQRQASRAVTHAPAPGQTQAGPGRKAITLSDSDLSSDSDDDSSDEGPAQVKVCQSQPTLVDKPKVVPAKVPSKPVVKPVVKSEPDRLARALTSSRPSASRPRKRKSPSSDQAYWRAPPRRVSCFPKVAVTPTTTK